MKYILTLTLMCLTLLGFSQTQTTLPAGSTAYGSSLYKDPQGFIWTGKPGSYTNLGYKNWADSAIARSANKFVANGFDPVNPNPYYLVSSINSMNTVATQAGPSLGFLESGSTGTPEGASASTKGWAYINLPKSDTESGQFAMALSGTNYNTNSLFYRTNTTQAWKTIWDSNNLTNASRTNWDNAYSWRFPNVNAVASTVTTTTLAAATDINSFNGGTSYAVNTQTNGTGTAGILFSGKASGNNGGQIMIGIDGTLRARGVAAAVWTSWNRLWNSNDFTSTNVANWNTAFGWGNHAGLYKPISYVPSWSEITGKPGAMTADSYKVNALNTAPASATATGTVGEIRYTSDYIYICVGTNTWKRAAITTW